eukprot:SAG31_NODE_33703_length_341_cov_0.433884_1_plen_69_part_00
MYTPHSYPQVLNLVVLNLASGCKYEFILLKVNLRVNLPVVLEYDYGCTVRVSIYSCTHVYLGGVRRGY